VKERTSTSLLAPEDRCTHRPATDPDRATHARWVTPHRAAALRRRFPRCARQHDRTDCGPAALLSVLNFWGGDAPLPFLRDLAGTDLTGTGLLGLAGAARSVGFHAVGAAGDYDQLARETLPCIAHVHEPDGRPHFVAVFRMRSDRIFLGDPARGRRWLSRSEFEAIWLSRAVLLLAPAGPLIHHAPPDRFRWIGQYLRAEHGWLVQSIFLGAVSAGLGLATALFVQWLIDRFIPERNTGMIVATGLVLLAVLVLRAGAAHIRHIFLLGVNRRASLRLNQDYLERMFRLPLRFFESRATGDLTARVADGVRIQAAALEILGTVVIDGMVVLGSLVFLFLLAPPIGWLAVASLPPWTLALALSARQLRSAQADAMSAWAASEAHLIDTIRGMRDILGFGVGPAFAQSNGHLHGVFQERSEALGRVRARLDLVTELGGGTLVVAALVHGALLVVEGRLQLGEVMAGYALLGGLLPSAHRLVTSGASFQEASVASSRLRDILLAPPENDPGDRPFVLRRELRVEQGVFAWPSGDVALNGVDLTLRPGEVTGLWGPNGAGKTTLMGALNRTRPLSSGRILVDGVSAEDLSLDQWRKGVATLPADIRLFRGSLADNVLLGRDLSTDDASPAHLEAAGIREFLDRFPAGWETPIGEGARRLSTGERQVIGLLRALMGGPELLLVDEGVRSTDGALSEILLELILGHGRQHTVLIVSHDPAILARTDRLVVLREGRIEMEGPPADTLPELLATHPMFRMNSRVRSSPGRPEHARCL